MKEPVRNDQCVQCGNEQKQKRKEVSDMSGLTGRKLIASRCAKFFKDGDFVNLGIGVTLMCVNYLPEGVEMCIRDSCWTVFFLLYWRGT